MTEDGATLCRCCAEEIKPSARLCPFCQSRQKGLFLGRVGMQAIGLMLLGGAVWILCIWLVSEPRKFSRYRGQVVVLDSQLTQVGDPLGVALTIQGMLTNRSNYDWQFIALEVRFLDRQGALVDTTTHTVWPMVLSHSEHSFKIDVPSYRPIKSGYATHEVLVKNAEPSGLF